MITLNPQVFEDAADLIDIRTSFACNAINLAFTSLKKEDWHCSLEVKSYQQIFREIFMPENKTRDNPWWELADESDNPRIIALLLCAEIVREQNKSIVYGFTENK